MFKNNEKSFEIIVAIIVCLAVVDVARATPLYVVVDDFEAYSSDSDLRDVWEDYHTLPEQGAVTYLQLASSDPCLVHYGNQSLHFEYNWQYGTPVTRCTYDTPQDWTSHGLAALVLWFYGDANDGAGNTADGMYVTLEDSDGDKAAIAYDGDVNDLIAKDWMEWNIALKDFNDANNVNPDRTMSIALGITGGTSGRIYFDDIRLYVPRCIPKYATDITRDCFTDYEDLEIMADEWLTSGIKADLVEDNNVNFKDYAFLMDYWLTWQLFP